MFWDYPQIGYDEDAVILTANKFNPGYIGSTVVWLPKHRMYAGLGFSFCFFNNGIVERGHAHAANRPGPGTLYHDGQRGTRRRLHQGDKVD